MKIFLLLLFLFLVGCLGGYVLEVLYRRFVSAKRWVNPGFMRGPWLPLYGFGVVLMYVVCSLFYRYMPASLPLYNPNDFMGTGNPSGATWADLIPIFSIGIGLSLLELIAGIVFVKGFHVRLWDYSNMKGNIGGVVCPLFSVIWFVGGLGFYYGVNPFLTRFADSAYHYMFGTEGVAAHFGFIFFMGVTYGVMLVDFIISIGMFNKLSAFAKKSGIAMAYDHLIEERKQLNKEKKQKFISHLPIRLQLELDKPKKELAISKKIKSVIYIDPEKEGKPSQNYDEKGRPISDKKDDNSK